MKTQKKVFQTTSKIDLLTIKSGDLIRLHYTVFFNQTVEEAALYNGGLEGDVEIRFPEGQDSEMFERTCENFTELLISLPEIKNILVQKLDDWYYTGTSGILKKINSAKFEIIEKL